MRLGPLYHWAPAGRRAAILAEGLVPGKSNTVATTPLDYLCLGFSASGAWALSGGTVEHVEAWDLWQVDLADGDWVRVREECGPTMCEVTLAKPVPPDRIWLVGTRGAT